MNDTIISKIKENLKESEGTVKHPYLDSNGLVHAGVGFNVDKKSDFTALDFWTRDRDGTERRATPGEKSAAYDKMTAARKANNGDHNRIAESYESKTNVFLPGEVMEKKLDDKAREHMAGAKKEVGEDAWNKLKDGQKTAVTDIRYANGSLDKFPKLKDAIKEGDANKMAAESTFFTNSKTGQRDKRRLERNFQGLSGLSREESDKRLQDVLKKNDAARKSSPIGNATPPVKPAPPDKPGDASFGDNGPTGQDDGADDDTSGGGAQKQSANVTNPQAPTSTLLHKLGDDTGNEIKELTPEQQNLLDDFGKTDGPLDDILAKDPEDLTNEEFLEIKKEVIRLSAGPEQEQLDGVAMEFLKDKFGDGLAKFDAVGRMIDPKPIRAINKSPVPAKTPGGELLQNAISKIGKDVAETAGDEGSATAVQGLQRGLNLLKQVALRGGAKGRVRTPAIVQDLKTDGIVGPKTRRALKIVTSRLGTPRIKEGLALGRFGKLAEDIQTGRADTRSLKPTIAKSFGSLFRNPSASLTPRRGQRPNRAPEENLAFQSTINDLGANAFGRDTFKPIREDGLIGPRTESAFNTILPAAGPDRFTSRLGHNLGFFDFDDIA